MALRVPALKLIVMLATRKLGRRQLESSDLIREQAMAALDTNQVGQAPVVWPSLRLIIWHWYRFVFAERDDFKAATGRVCRSAKQLALAVILRPPSVQE
jgi:hypothetical protein